MQFDLVCVRGLVVRIVALTVLLLAVSVSLAAEPELRYEVRIPKTNAADALNMLAEQTGALLLFPYDLVKTRDARAVSGRYTVPEAVDLLLEGTDLSSGLSKRDVITISLSESEARAKGGKTMKEDLNKGKPGLFGRLASIAALVFSGADGVSAQSETTSARSNVMEEIIVTATRREQRSEDLGLSLAVLSADALDQRRIQGLEGLRQAVPSLDVFRGNGSNNPTITLRGIGTTNPWVNNNPSIAAHMDGFYLPMSTYLNFPMFDLERVEVLKGPQVGLYGRNSTGGAINLVSRRPTSQFEGYVDASYGSYEMADLQGAISGSLGDRLRGRLAGIVQDGGGYMDRPGTAGSTAGFSRIPGLIPGVAAVSDKDDYGDRDVVALRGSLEFIRAGDFDAFLTVHYGRDESEIVGSTNVNGDVLGVFQPPDDDPHMDYDNVEPFTDSKQRGAVLELNWYRGPYRITSITGYEALERDYGIGDFVPLRIAEPTFNEDIDSFGQEVRVDYQREDGVRWLAGVSYSRDNIDYSRPLLGYDFLLGTLGTAFDQEDKAFAAFGHLEMPINAEWSWEGSLRYTEEDKEFDGGSFPIDPFGVSAVGVAFPNVVPDGLFGNPEYDDDDVSGKLAVNWEPNDRILWYASAGRSFKSGGFDGSGVTVPAAFDPFGAETVWAYELGSKYRSMNGRLFVGGSAFYYDYEDKQVLALMDLGGGVTEAVIQNAATSEVYGLDLEIRGLITDNLDAALNLTVMESEVTDWESADPAEIADREGNDLPGTPDTMLTASINWERPLANGWTLDTSLWGTYVSSAFRDIQNSRLLESDDYGIVNARIEALNPGGAWKLYVFAENLLDKEYVTSVRSLVGMRGEYHGRPRTVGVGLRYEVPR